MTDRRHHANKPLLAAFALAAPAVFAASCKNSVQGVAPGGETARDAVAPAVFTAAPLLDASQIRTLTATSETLLKARVADSSALQPNEKCTVGRGFVLAIVGAPTPSSDRHFRVTLAPTNSLPGCALFNSTNGAQTAGSVLIYGPHFGVEGVNPGTTNTDAWKTPLSEFIDVMVGGSSVTSAWCVERSVGTCPHVGVDTVGRPAEGLTKSYAMSNGVVEGIVDMGSCGWGINFRDSAGALWQYVHRKKPGYQRGQKLYRGELVGVWYGGRSSCVTGPHLHLERKQAGEHGGSKKGFTCRSRNQGYRNCNFDPLTPLKNKRVVRSETEMSSIAKSSKEGALGSPSLSLVGDTVSRGPSLIPLQFECNASQPPPTVGSGFDLSLSEFSGLRAKVRARDYGTDSFVISVEAALENNFDAPRTSSNGLESVSNSCGENGENECIDAWELHVKAADGKWHRHYAEQGMRNVPLALSFERDYCVNKTLLLQARVVALTSHNRVLVSESELEKEPIGSY